MGKQKGQFARLYIDEQAIFTSSPEFNYSQDVKTVDSSVYGDSFDQFEVLSYNGKLDINAFIEDDFRGPGDVADQLSDKFFHEQLIDPSTGLVVTSPALITAIMKESPVAGDVALFTQGYGGIQWAMPRDGLVAIRLNMTETGAINHGKIIGIFEQTVVVGTPYESSEVLIGDPSATNGFIRAGMHITSWANVVGTPTLEVKLQSDTTGFPSEADRLTFTDTAIADLAHEYKEVVAAYSGETYMRFVLTMSGTATHSATVGGVIVAITG